MEDDPGSGVVGALTSGCTVTWLPCVFRGVIQQVPKSSGGGKGSNGKSEPKDGDSYGKIVKRGHSETKSSKPNGRDPRSGGGKSGKK